MRMNKGKPFAHVKADSMDAPTFSEAFLYEAVGKGDARFILGVADEYEHVIEALGPKAVRAILAIKPALVNRLGTGEKVVEWLDDARDLSDQLDEERWPSQVILDDDAAQAVWHVLHESYCQHFDPERSMDDDQLRTYHLLTDRLGPSYQERRQKEQDRLPEKLERQEARKAQLEARKEARKEAREIRDAVDAALEGEGDAQEALRRYVELNGPVKVP